MLLPIAGIATSVLAILSEDDDSSLSDALQRSILTDDFSIIAEAWKSQRRLTARPLYVELVQWVNDAESLDELLPRYRALYRTFKAIERSESSLNFGVIGKANVRFSESMMGRNFSTQTLMGVPLVKTFGGTLAYPIWTTNPSEEQISNFMNAAIRCLKPGEMAEAYLAVGSVADVVTWDEDRLLVELDPAFDIQRAMSKRGPLAEFRIVPRGEPVLQQSV